LTNTLGEAHKGKRKKNEKITGDLRDWEAARVLGKTWGVTDYTRSSSKLRKGLSASGGEEEAVKGKAKKMVKEEREGGKG